MKTLRNNMDKFILTAVILTLCLGFAYADEKEEQKLYTNGKSACIMGKWGQAQRTFGRLLQKYPRTKYRDARFWLGYSLIETKNYQMGIDNLEQFTQQNPGSNLTPQAIYKIGEVYEKRFHNYGKATLYYEKVIRMHPNNQAVLSASQNQAFIYSNRKYEFDKALSELKKSKSLAQNQGISSKSLYVERAEGRINFIREHKDFGYEPLKIFTRGMNFEEEKKWDNAVQQYKQIREKYKDARIADDAQLRVILCYKQMASKNFDRKKSLTNALSEAKLFMKWYPSSPHVEEVQKLITELSSR